jgi:hypothetical protein
MRQVANGWTLPHDSLLEACLAEGKSASMIADALNKEFGTVYSRCSVIGRAARLRVHDGNGSVPGTVASTTRRMSLRGPVVAPVNVEPVPLLELRPFHCRAVLNERGDDGLALFCGVNRCEGSSYCDHHRARFVAQR